MWKEKEKRKYTYLNAEFQRIARRDKRAFLSDQCKEIEENNGMGKTRDLFEKIRDTKGWLFTFSLNSRWKNTCYHFAILHFFFLGMVLITASCTMSPTSIHSSSGTLSYFSLAGLVGVGRMRCCLLVNQVDPPSRRRKAGSLGIKPQRGWAQRWWGSREWHWPHRATPALCVPREGLPESVSHFCKWLWTWCG